MGLTSYGFYPCGAGASLDRVFRFNVGTKNLISVNNNSIQNQFNVLCRYCGHSPTKIRQKTKNAILSKSWIEAYKKYNSGDIKEMEKIYR
jgi:ABC-type thiamine transport system substrate-binding protein